jgi:hypothetical protein
MYSKTLIAQIGRTDAALYNRFRGAIFQTVTTFEIGFILYCYDGFSKYGYSTILFVRLYFVGHFVHLTVKVLYKSIMMLEINYNIVYK